MSVFSSFFKKAPTTQMRAVLHIISADSSLEALAMPHIDLPNEKIVWKPIFKNLTSLHHRAAVLIAYSVWTDRVRSSANPFEAAVTMETPLKRACLEAIAMRWGLLN